MPWYVYIAACGDGSLYTGIAKHPGQRLQQHNRGRGSAYVRSRGGATLRYLELRRSRADALRRERTIQAWRREQKLALIASSRHV